MATLTHPIIAHTKRVESATRFALQCAVAAAIVGAIPVIGFLGIAVAQSGAFVALVGVVLAVIFDEGLLEPFFGFWACHAAAIFIFVWQFVFMTWRGIHLLSTLKR